MKRTTSDWFEMAGYAAGAEMLDNLLSCPSQGAALPFVVQLLGKVSEVRDEDDRRAIAGGAAVTLVEILLTGIAGIKNGRSL